MAANAPLITKFALDKRPQFTRASKPKVRTGCITCRRRRKKCDETKPACVTCLKYSGVCEGYKNDKGEFASLPPGHRVVYPKLAGGKARDGLPREPNYASLVFSDQLEKDHFDYWLAFTSTAVLSRSDLLLRIIPQLSWKDPAMRHAALAIGAVALGSSTREQRLLGQGRFYSDALQHYGKALKLLHSSPMSVERSLLACLLFITFESIRGNKAAGLNHMNHGSRILNQYFPEGQAPGALLEEVMSSFHAVGLQAWSHGGAHLAETGTRVPWCCRGRRKKYAVEEMPTVFENLDVARRRWDIVQHFIQNRAPIRTGFEVAGAGSIDREAFPDDYGSPESQRHVRGFMRYLDSWNLAFIPLAVKAERNKQGNLQDFTRALGLRIHYLYLWTGVHSGGWTDLEDVRRMEAVFREIVALSRPYLEIQQRSSGGQEVFTLENSPTWALALSCLMSRAPDLREEIVSLFKEYPRRDGLWDTQVFVVLLEWLNDMLAADEFTDDHLHIMGCRVVVRDYSASIQKQWRDPKTQKLKRFYVKFNTL